jgi:hypothetical protein
MKQQFRLYRGSGGIYYIHDDKTGKQESQHCACFELAE